jgi:hypothetical protein
MEFLDGEQKGTSVPDPWDFSTDPDPDPDPDQTPDPTLTSQVTIRTCFKIM